MITNYFRLQEHFCNDTNEEHNRNPSFQIITKGTFEENVLPNQLQNVGEKLLFTKAG